jgi:phage-related protein
VDIKAVQIGWPMGMPIVRKLEPGLWEVRIDLATTIARVFFTIVGCDMVLLHGFIKKSQKTPLSEIATARQRKSRL